MPTNQCTGRAKKPHAADRPDVPSYLGAIERPKRMNSVDFHGLIGELNRDRQIIVDTWVNSRDMVRFKTEQDHKRRLGHARIARIAKP